MSQSNSPVKSDRAQSNSPVKSDRAQCIFNRHKMNAFAHLSHNTHSEDTYTHIRFDFSHTLYLFLFHTPIHSHTHISTHVGGRKTAVSQFLNLWVVSGSMLCMAYFTVGSDEERMKLGLKKFALAACAANNNNNNHNGASSSNGNSNGIGVVVNGGMEGGSGTSSTSVTSSSVKLNKRMSFNETYVVV